MKNPYTNSTKGFTLLELLMAIAARLPLLALLVAVPTCAVAEFSPPTAKEQLDAIGPTHALSTTLKRAFAPGPEFAPIRVPGPRDWLTVHEEQAQGYADYLLAKPPRPEGKHRIIYLQLLGDFTKDQTRLLDTVKDYAAAYFGLPMGVLPPADPAAGVITTRYHPTPKNRQLLSTDILALLKQDRPPDAFCVLGITMDDLYPEPSWNFVFGQASLSEGGGVYSFARYDPAFYGMERGDDYETVLARSEAARYWSMRQVTCSASPTASTSHVS
jgi:archaemetzincin